MKPIKRHPALISLSREHHEGLLLAIRLKQGKKALERLWSHDPQWQAEFIVKFFEDHLAHHFAAEEQIIFPAIKTEASSPVLPIVERLIAEHQEMRMLVEFFRAPEEKKLECNLIQFGEILESHIRCEEREFFPLLEAGISEDMFSEINQQLHEQFPELPHATSND